MKTKLLALLFLAGTCAAQINNSTGAGSANTLSGTNSFTGDVSFKSGRPWIDVIAYGAKGDGATDDAAAINAALTAAQVNPGTTVFFPCGPGTTYLIRSPLVISTGRIKLLGSSGIVGGVGNACEIEYSATSGNAAAVLNMIGAVFVTLDGISIFSDNTANLPAAGIMMGRTSAAGAGSHQILNSSVRGYYTGASVYSIASEQNVWSGDYINIAGGGATAVFYTSTTDGLSICSPACTGSSNLSVWVSTSSIVSNVTNYAGDVIYEFGNGTGGDHSYRDLYMAVGQGGNVLGNGIHLSAASNTAFNNASYIFDGIRIENGNNFMVFDGGADTSHITTYFNINLSNSTGGAQNTNFISSANFANCTNCRIQGNKANKPLVFYQLTGSYIQEMAQNITVNGSISGNQFITNPSALGGGVNTLSLAGTNNYNTFTKFPDFTSSNTGAALGSSGSPVTIITPAVASVYQVCYILRTQTTDASGATITASIAANAGATTITNTSASISLASLNGAGATTGCVIQQVGAGSTLGYYTTVSGSPTTGLYKLQLYVQPL